MESCFLTAADAAVLIATRKLSAEELVRSCLARIAERDAAVRAWLHLEPELSIRCARELDKLQSRSPVHGLPFGVKDVIDTIDMPTTQNSAIYAGARIGRDAACVAAMRHSGALMLARLIRWSLPPVAAKHLQPTHSIWRILLAVPPPVLPQR